VNIKIQGAGRMNVELSENVLADKQNIFTNSEKNLRGVIMIGVTKVGDCVVKKFTEEGAEIVVTSGSWIPSVFNLQLSDGYPSVTAKKLKTTGNTMRIEFT